MSPVLIASRRSLQNRAIIREHLFRNAGRSGGGWFRLVLAGRVGGPARVVAPGFAQ